MQQKQPQLTFPDVDPATAGRYAQELRTQLLDASRPEASFDVQLEREHPEALDVGSMVVLGVHVVTPILAHVIATTIFEWAKWRQTKVKIKNGVYEIHVDYRAGDAFVKELVTFLSTGNRNAPEPVPDQPQ